MGLKDNICVFEDRKLDGEMRSSVELFSFFLKLKINLCGNISKFLIHVRNIT